MAQTGKYRHPIGFLLIGLTLLISISSCKSVKPVEGTNTGFIESMKASENVLIWVYIPQAIQCGKAFYINEDNAVADLKSHDIEVFDSFSFNRIVTANCGAPTSEQFAAQIKEYDLNRARKLEWQFLEDETIIENNKPK